MFGLGEEKGKKPKEFIFELEKELKDPKKYEEILKKMEGRTQGIKEMLRSGQADKEFDQFSTVLKGYAAILKVMSRVHAKR